MKDHNDRSISRGEIVNRPPGFDPLDPYENKSLKNLPNWWRKAVNLFDNYDLRPFRPPRFKDDVFKHEVIDRLESEFNINIQFRCFEDRCDGDWEIQIDGKLISHVGRHRSTAGYSVFEITSEEFEKKVREHIES